jgi:ABC-2 type transport system ATP-binding protein
MDEAEHCHRLGFVQRGRLVALGTPEEIKADKMSGKVIEIDCSNPTQAMELLDRSNIFNDVSLYGAQIHVVAKDADRQLISIRRDLTTEGISVSNIAIIPPSLEDVFISSTRENEIEEGDVR